MKKNILGCSLAMSIAFFSCESPKKTSITMDELTRFTWKLQTINNVANPAYSEGDLFTLLFSANDSTISGLGACNHYFGKIKFEKNGEVDFDMGASTMMACPGLEQEREFFNMLDEADDIKMVNDSLVMYNDNKAIAKFIPYIAIVNDGHNAANSLDYWGTYTTDLSPDKDKIKASLTLNQDNTYSFMIDHLHSGDQLRENGNYVVDKNTLILTSDKSKTYFKVGENRLIKLDDQGNPITNDPNSKYELFKDVQQ